MARKHGPTSEEWYKAAQKRQDQDRNEKAGLPREKAEADDHPDDDGKP